MVWLLSFRKNKKKKKGNPQIFFMCYLPQNQNVVPATKVYIKPTCLLGAINFGENFVS